jgi:hypothetical protein
MVEGYDVLSVVLWYSAIFSLLHQQLNIILSNKDNLFTIFLIVAALGGLQYWIVQYGLYGAIIQCYVR